MMLEAALVELLARVGAGKGAAALFSEEELGYWAAAAVKAMKAKRLLVKTRPSVSAVCPGCEQECVMPVNALPAGPRKPQPFIVCDKRSDINRVAVPISRLEQWQASGTSIADLIAGLLALPRPDSDATSAGRWEVGVFKGAKRSSHLVLLADGKLALSLAGHSITLAEVLTLENSGFKIDKGTMARLVDNPVAGAGDAESAAQRRARLKKRVQAERNRGNKTFLKTIAEEEGISLSRLKQLLSKSSEPAKTQF